jgi:hypothetical protein
VKARSAAAQVTIALASRLVRSALRELLGNEAEVCVQSVDKIQLEPSGKRPIIEVLQPNNAAAGV